MQQHVVWVIQVSEKGGKWEYSVHDSEIGPTNEWTEYMLPWCSVWFEWKKIKQKQNKTHESVVLIWESISRRSVAVVGILVKLSCNLRRKKLFIFTNQKSDEWKQNWPANKSQLLPATRTVYIRKYPTATFSRTSRGGGGLSISTSQPGDSMFTWQSWRSLARARARHHSQVSVSHFLPSLLPDHVFIYFFSGGGGGFAWEELNLFSSHNRCSQDQFAL